MRTLTCAFLTVSAAFSMHSPHNFTSPLIMIQPLKQKTLLGETPPWISSGATKKPKNQFIRKERGKSYNLTKEPEDQKQPEVRNLRNRSIKLGKIIEKKKEEEKKSYDFLYNHVTQKIKQQDSAVEKICNSVCSYRSFLEGNYFKNPRVLIYGPSGCGKTAIVSEIAQKMNIPFFTINASALTGAGFKGTNLSDQLTRIIVECQQKKYKKGEIIIFFDEIDKLFFQALHQETTPGSPLNELLVFMEKGLEEGEGYSLSTEKSMLFFAGAFHQVSIQSAQKAFPEFFGRITNLVEIKKLKPADFKEILLNSSDSPLVTMKEYLQKHNRTLIMEDAAVNYITRYSEKRGTGSRAIQYAMNELLQPYFGKKSSVQEIVITEADCKKLFDDFMNDDSHLPPRGMYI